MNENKVRRELIKLEKEGLLVYKLPDDFNEWTKDEQDIIFMAIIALENKIDFKQEFIKAYRRKVFVFSFIFYCIFCIMSPLIAGIGTSMLVGAFYLFERHMTIV